jgi:hypothetical protein
MSSIERREVIRRFETRERQYRERLAILSSEWHRLLPASEDRIVFLQLLETVYIAWPLSLYGGSSA